VGMIAGLIGSLSGLSILRFSRRGRREV